MRKSFNFLFIFLCCLGFFVSSVFAGGPPNKRRKWSPDEDERLKIGVLQLGEHSWRRVSEEFVCTRNPRQCRNRWKSYHSVEESSPWDCRSDDILLELHENYGPKWSFIASLMPGRSEISVKNRYNYLTYKYNRELELIDKSWTDLETMPRAYGSSISDALSNLEFFDAPKVPDFKDDAECKKTIIPEAPKSISCDALPSLF